jgi:hypothetical protein
MQCTGIGGFQSFDAAGRPFTESLTAGFYGEDSSV